MEIRMSCSHVLPLDRTAFTRAFWLTGLLALMFALTACASGRDTDTDSDTRSYVRNAAVGDLFEIESSRLALDRSASAEVHDFAEMMVADHSKMSEKLEDAVDRADLAVDIPDELDSRHQAMLDRLENAGMAEFDQLYAEMQATAHEEAFALHQRYAENGSVPELRTLAGNAVPVIDHHRTAVRQLP